MSTVLIFSIVFLCCCINLGTLAQFTGFNFNGKSKIATEGVPFSIPVTIENPTTDLDCHVLIQTSLKLEATTNDIFPAGQVKTINFLFVFDSSIADKPCSTAIAQLELRCSMGSFKKDIETIRVKDADGTGCDDPHFKQIIQGVDGSNLQTIQMNVCYDLYGNSGDIYEILTDNILDLSLFIQLRGDYYIGRILLKTADGFINISTQLISLPNYLTFDWNSGQFTPVESNIASLVHVQFNENGDIYINSISNNEREERFFAIEISRVYQKIGKYYLNFRLKTNSGRGNNDGVLDDTYTGLMAHVYNSRYKFYYPVQEFHTNTVVNVNGRFVQAWMKNSPTIVKVDEDNEKDESDNKISSSSCISVRLNDLIYPKTAKHFKIKTLNKNILPA
ncbi:unnamed protein product [Dimorphilus gyrociliatus]|uniref:Uncharacterized protein n=1 Tax=Dimorphilus gyrociliatus TaxID=2664684 RepID=A0A7I8VC10_9ANNE|nr:unnamed protein product [Dimorphilus gyrociliatus]